MASTMFTKSILRRTLNFCRLVKICRIRNVRYFGQPTAKTHPHLLMEGQVTPGITKTEYQHRRCTLLRNAVKHRRKDDSAGKNSNSEFSDNTILIFPSASKVFMSYDIPYTFRQNTEFLYLCGFQEPDSVLIILNEHSNKNKEVSSKSVLFVPRKDPTKELWDGPRSGIEGTLSFTGVDTAHNIDDLGMFLYQYRKEQSSYNVWYNFTNPVHAALHDQFLARFLQESRNCYFEKPQQLVQNLRVLKSPAETYLLQVSAEIASKSLVEVMKYCKPGVNEAHLYAKMEFECRTRGADYLSYPPVVAGGARANIIHYISNNQIINNGELVLMDAGCEYHGYTSDLTRTWPVSGRFTPEQKQLYDAVLATQEACLKMCTTDYSLDDIYREMLIVLGHQLQSIGIIPSDIRKKDILSLATKFCPHHVGHYLGMDVHDTSEISRQIKLKPGMVITIEPGVYIPVTQDHVPPQFRGMGIRIEDNVLITETSPTVMSNMCPKSTKEIEYVMNS